MLEFALKPFASAHEKNRPAATATAAAQARPSEDAWAKASARKRPPAVSGPAEQRHWAANTMFWAFALSTPQPDPRTHKKQNKSCL